MHQRFLDNSFSNPNIVRQFFESTWHGKQKFVDKTERYNGESHISI